MSLRTGSFSHPPGDLGTIAGFRWCGGRPPTTQAARPGPVPASGDPLAVRVTALQTAGMSISPRPPGAAAAGRRRGGLRTVRVGGLRRP